MRWPLPVRFVVAPFLAATAIAMHDARAADLEVLYRVKPGDYLISIADAHLRGGASNENVQALARLNRLANPNRLVPGTALRVPVALLITVPNRAVVADTFGEATLDGKPITKGTPIEEGARVKTGESGGVMVELADGSKVWVRNDSQTSFESMRGAPAFDYADTGIVVESGRIDTIVNKLRGQSRFEIRSPTAKLGVRGTEFRVGADADASRVEVLGGLVAASGASIGGTGGREVAVASGFGSVVDRSGQPSEPVKLLPPPSLDAVPQLVEDIAPRLAVEPVAGAVRYRGTLVDAGTGYVVAQRVEVTPLLRFTEVPDGRYVLQVRAVDGQNLEGLNAERAFTVKARPQPPFTTQPTDRATVRGDEVTLGWTASEGAATYRLQIATDAAFKSVVVDRPRLASPQLATRLAPGDYYWRLASVDAKSDQGPFSVARQFALRPLPSAPASAPPAVSADRIAFAWNGLDNQQFDFELARDDKFTDKVLSQRLAAKTLDLPKPPPGSYFARIRAIDPDGTVGPYTPVQRLDLPAAPLSPWWLLAPFLVFLLL